MKTRLVAVTGLFVWLMTIAAALAQPLFTDAFPPEEFAAHRGRVIERIGDGVAPLDTGSLGLRTSDL